MLSATCDMRSLLETVGAFFRQHASRSPLLGGAESCLGSWPAFTVMLRVLFRTPRTDCQRLLSCLHLRLGKSGENQHLVQSGAVAQR